jgi:hypothetical protein
LCPYESDGVVLELAGADVWFDDWEISAGESIPGKLDEGLSAFNIFVVVWSTHAARSHWVRHELEVALSRQIRDPLTRIIPVRLDDTALPTNLNHFRYIRLEEGKVAQATKEILGLRTQRDLIKALQAGLDAMELRAKEFWGAGTFIGCPQCGAPVTSLKVYEEIDDAHDRRYVGAQCTECGWNEGGEM